MLSSILALVLGTVAAVVRADAVATPAPPTLSFLYSLNCTLGDQIEIGAGPRGTRVAIPIIGGSFAGPQLNGKVLNLGADWGLISPNGTFSADTRYNLLTDDGANIFLQTSGPQQADNKLHLRIIFETGSTKYYWLNNVIAVGILTPATGYVLIDAWAIGSPRNVTAQAGDMGMIGL